MFEFSRNSGVNWNISREIAEFFVQKKNKNRTQKNWKFDFVKKLISCVLQLQTINIVLKSFIENLDTLTTVRCGTSYSIHCTKSAQSESLTSSTKAKVKKKFLHRQICRTAKLKQEKAHKFHVITHPFTSTKTTMEGYWDQASLPAQTNGHSAPPHPVKFERWENFVIFLSFRKKKITFLLSGLHTIIVETRVFGLNSVHSTLIVVRCSAAASQPATPSIRPSLIRFLVFHFISCTWILRKRKLAQNFPIPTPFSVSCELWYFSKNKLQFSFQWKSLH